MPTKRDYELLLSAAQRMSELWASRIIAGDLDGAYYAQRHAVELAEQAAALKEELDALEARVLQ